MGGRGVGSCCGGGGGAGRLVFSLGSDDFTICLIRLVSVGADFRSVVVRLRGV